jgi:hypothetical protein
MFTVRWSRLFSVASSNGDPPVAGRSTSLRVSRCFDLLLAAQVAAGDRGLAAHDLLGCALGHDFASQMAGAGAEVHEPVRRRHGFAIVLDHDQGVADVPQVAQGVQQFNVVALVQPDGGFIQNVEDAGEFGTHLGGQTDALGFSAGEGGALAAEGQVIQPTLTRKRRRPMISLSSSVAMILRLPVSFNPVRKSWASRMVISVTSMIERSPMRTASTSGFRRRPLQASQGRVERNRP